MFRKLASVTKSASKFVVYTVTGCSACYCGLRYGGSIGKCEDISMEPAIKHGDYVFISPIPVDYKWLKTGDIVFSRAPKNPGSVICKRLKGFEGDEIYNNEKNTDEDVRKGHVWLEGDYQEASIDSRSYGPVPYGLLTSKVVFRIWPIQRIGPIPMPDEKTLISKEPLPLLAGELADIVPTLLKDKKTSNTLRVSFEKEKVQTTSNLFPASLEKEKVQTVSNLFPASLEEEKDKETFKPSSSVLFEEEKDLKPSNS